MMYTHEYPTHLPRYTPQFENSDWPWPFSSILHEGLMMNFQYMFSFDYIYDDPEYVEATYNPLLLLFLIVLPIPFRFLWNFLWSRLNIFDWINSEKNVSQKERQRTRDSIFFIIHLITSYSYCSYLTWNESFRDPWAEPGKPYYYCWNDRMDTYAILPSVKLTYNLVTAFYLHGLISITFFEEKKKDFWLLFTHHVVTLVLIWVSVLARHHKIGVVIMMLMDINDIELELSKIFHRLGKSHLAAIAFITFVLNWFWNRLYIFPFYALYSYHFVAYFMGCMPRAEGPCDAYWQLNMGLSWAIFWMSVYWSYLILGKLKGIVVVLWKEGLMSAMKDGEDPRELEAEMVRPCRANPVTGEVASQKQKVF